MSPRGIRISKAGGVRASKTKDFRKSTNKMYPNSTSFKAQRLQIRGVIRDVMLNAIPLDEVLLPQDKQYKVISSI